MEYSESNNLKKSYKPDRVPPNIWKASNFISEFHVRIVKLLLLAYWSRLIFINFSLATEIRRRCIP